MDQQQQRDDAEEAANRALMEERNHCVPGTSEEEDGHGFTVARDTTCTDVDGGGECVHCPCCCGCMGCLYGPRDGEPLTAAQRAPIEAWQPTS